MRKVIILLVATVCMIAIPSKAYGMHIAEGAISFKWCLVYFLISAPLVILSVKRLRELTKKSGDVKMLLAVMGAYVFMMSAMKLPSVTGSSSHPTGTGLGAIIFGPVIMVLISLIVLIFQALLLAHGGLTTLGANVFSMGIVGPFIAYFIYRLLKNKNREFAVFLACALGDLLTYVITSLQLALAYPSESFGVVESATKFLGVFSITQIPLAIVEGILGVVIYRFIMKHCKGEISELEEGLV